MDLHLLELSPVEVLPADVSVRQTAQGVLDSVVHLLLLLAGGVSLGLHLTHSFTAGTDGNITQQTQLQRPVVP